MIRIFNHYISKTVLGILVGDLLVVILSILALSYVPNAVGTAHMPLNRSLLLSIGIWVLLSGFLFFQAGLYETGIFENTKRKVIRIASAFVVLAIIEWALFAFFPQIRMSPTKAILLPVFAFIGILAWRFFGVSYFPNFRWNRRMLILGTFQIDKIFDELDHFKHNVCIAGVVGPDRVKTFDLLSFSLQNGIHSIVISIKDRRGTLPIQNILKCKMNGIDVVEWPTFYERHTNKIDILNINPSHLILSDGFQKKFFTLFIKNSMDFLLSLVGLVVFLPVGLLIALLIKIESPGPVFYLQERVGLNGKTFKIMKFRSMVADAEKGTPPKWATEDDPRITRIGRFLRKTRLDEAPQLINILKGEMSFVGPRPERPYFVSELEISIPFYSQRHVTKPGLSGWAQIRYRYGATIEDAIKKLEYDLYYIKNLSIFLDLMILLETVQVVLFRRGSR